MLNLHNTLADQGIYAASVAINAMITTGQAPNGFPSRTPDELAAMYWTLHTDRRQSELIVGG